MNSSSAELLYNVLQELGYTELATSLRQKKLLTDQVSEEDIIQALSIQFQIWNLEEQNNASFKSSRSSASINSPSNRSKAPIDY
ncbi:MAG: hypothetical protein MUF12_00945 [Sediminibacterium sp.]|nr:hypothetical protein [Sediminibacterium sp.]